MDDIKNILQNRKMNTNNKLNKIKRREDDRKRDAIKSNKITYMKKINVSYMTSMYYKRYTYLRLKNITREYRSIIENKIK